MTAPAVVFQSAPAAHASWIEQCMTSVKQWAAMHRADYVVLDDAEFLGVVPEWVVGKCGVWINPVTDLARLLVARRLLCQYACAIWVDADVFVWAPKDFQLPITDDATFVRERWMERWPDGRLRFLDNVSNFVCSFAAGGRFLERHIDDVKGAVRAEDAPLKLGTAGTSLLTRRYSRGAFRLLDEVGNFSPVLLAALTSRETSTVDSFEAGLTRRLVAANLCLSHESRAFQERDANPGSLPRLVSALTQRSEPLWPSELLGAL